MRSIWDRSVVGPVRTRAADAGARRKRSHRGRSRGALSDDRSRGEAAAGRDRVHGARVLSDHRGPDRSRAPLEVLVFLEFSKNGRLQEHCRRRPNLAQRFAKWVRDGRLDTGMRFAGCRGFWTRPRRPDCWMWSASRRPTSISPSSTQKNRTLALVEKTRARWPQ